MLLARQRLRAVERRSTRKPAIAIISSTGDGDERALRQRPQARPFDEQAEAGRPGRGAATMKLEPPNSTMNSSRSMYGRSGA